MTKRSRKLKSASKTLMRAQYAHVMSACESTAILISEKGAKGDLIMLKKAESGISGCARG